MTTQLSAGQHPSSCAERILVVDDEGEYLKRVCRSLARGGFVTVLISNDVATAERLAGKHKPRLALIDLNLGALKQDGFACLKAIRSVSHFTLPVILSGDKSPHKIFRSAREGAIDYIVKGPSLDLPSEVTRILSGRRGATPGAPLPEVASDLGYLAQLGLTRHEIEVVSHLVNEEGSGAPPPVDPPPSERVLELIRAKLGVATTQQLLRTLAICELFRQENRIGGR